MKTPIASFYGLRISVFLPQRGSTRTTQSKIRAKSALLLSLSLIGLLVNSACHRVRTIDIIRTQTIINGLHNACENYRKEYGSYPSGSNPKIAWVLAGNNPHNTLFMALSPHEINGNGEAIDAWGTPIKFSFPKDGHPGSISSAGPERRFGAPDNIEFKWPPPESQGTDGQSK
jgi:hypothetical protein